MKYLYFWANIVTPHWLHTLQELAALLRVDVVVLSSSLDQPSERRTLAWSDYRAFSNIRFQAKLEVDVNDVPGWPAGYHLICNPFNDSFNRRLLSVLQRNGIRYGLQQSKPGLISSFGGKLMRKLGYGIFFRQTIANADYVLCHGEMCRRFLATSVGHHQKLFVSGYFVPGRKIARPIRIPGEPLRAFYLGQFIPRKRVLHLAKLLKRERARRNASHQFKMDFIGAGPQEQRLREVWTQADGRVLPPVKLEQVPDLMAEYDILVLASAADEWGVVVNEAIQAGCGVIVTEQCGSSDLVNHSGAGVVVPDVAGCVRALLDAVEEPQMVERWQAEAQRLAPLIGPHQGARYLARILTGMEHSEGKGACLPPWIRSASQHAELEVAIIYHFFAHYRLPIIRELMESDRISITCYGDSSSIRVDPTIKPITRGQLPSLQVTPIRSIANFVWQKDIIRSVVSKKYDVYIFLASPYFVSTWIAVILLRLLGRRVIYWGHLRFKEGEGYAKRIFRNIFYKMANGWLCYGHLAKRDLIKSGIDSKAVHVVYNSLDYERHLALRDSPPAALFSWFPRETEALPLFICVSRLVAKRRLDLLFFAAHALASQGKPVRLLLVGDGPERTALEALSANLNLNVLFFGACYNEAQLRELYRGSVATIAPGEVGLTAIQSLSFGVPVITHSDMDSQMPEAESVVEGVTGWLFKKHDLEDLVRAMRDASAADQVKMKYACFQMIDRFFNPRKQVDVIRRSSLGLEAKDSDWIAFIEEIQHERMATKSG